MTITSPRVDPKQERAMKRITAIVEAAAAVYKEKGRDHFTTQDVASRLGCSIGIIYRYFPDRVSLMDAFAPDRPWS